MSSGKVLVANVVNKSKTKSTPFLINFQNGDLNPNSDINLFLAKDDKNKNKELAILATKESIYTGETGNNGTDLVNTYMAIRNKQTNKVRFIQVNEVSLKNHIYNEDHEDTVPNMTREESNRTLLKNFGGRYAAVYLERMERTKVNFDIIKNQLEETAADYEPLNDDVEQLLNNEEVLPHIRPQCNKSAKTLDDVYKIENVIAAELLDRLDEEANTIISAKNELIPISSEYILQKINKIKESNTPTSEDSLLVIKTCIYMDALRNLIKLRQKNLSNALLSNITEKVENDIRVKFSHPGSTKFLRTKFTLHKGICYFIVLALIVEKEYEVNINTLVQELSIPKKDIAKFAHLVNAKVKGTADILHLRLPGQIKPLRLSTGQRKRN